ncbi:BnaA05g20060D [Brassica napus]|uniref:BnaA05g20060D protein n=3 Tax=Brassica TaxID=3705 RepID=A0A078G4J2_BRANA|nr:BnaA05g20060D [Brassica napus]
MKPRLDLLEKNQNGASSRLDEMEGRVVRQVESVLVKFKEDMINCVKDMVSGLCKDYFGAHVGPQYVSPPVRNDISRTSNHTTPVDDLNEVTIRNVLRNLSEYSTPPRSTRMSQDENRTPTMKDNHGSEYECVNPVPPNGAQSANSESRARQSSFQQRLELHKRKPHNLGEEPSFSLGLTQEEQSVGVVNVSVGEDEFADLVPPIHVADNIEERQLCRKSKRHKTVPSGLLETYQCGPHLLSRLREYRKFIFLLDDMSATERKFQKLSSDVKRNSVVNVSGIAVSVKEILFIVERRRNYSAKMSTALPVRLFHGAWRRNDDGYWIFQRKPSDLGYTVLINPTETFESLQSIIRDHYNFQPDTPFTLAYHPPEWLLEPEGTRTPPTPITKTSEVEAMMSLRSWYAELTLCVSSGPEDVAHYQFLSNTTFSVGGATFVFTGLTETELVSSKEVLQDIFNEQELVGIYRAHLEIEKAKHDRRNGASTSGSDARSRNEESGSPTSGSAA